MQEDNINDKISAFFSQYPQRTYPKGQILVFADESPEHIYYIARGKVRKYDVSYRGDEVVVNIFKHPAFFPMSWAINKSPNQFFYKTEETTTAHIVPSEDAVAFLKANPDVMFDLLSRIYYGLDGLLGRVVHLMSGTAQSRLIYELMIECRRFGVKAADGSYSLDISETDLATRAGVSRETISREIKKIKDKGWLGITRGQIIVTDVAALESFLGQRV